MPEHVKLLKDFEQDDNKTPKPKLGEGQIKKFGTTLYWLWKTSNQRI